MPSRRVDFRTAGTEQAYKNALPQEPAWDCNIFLSFQGQSIFSLLKSAAPKSSGLGGPRLVVLTHTGRYTFSASDTPRQVKPIAKFDAGLCFCCTDMNFFSPLQRSFLFQSFYNPLDLLVSHFFKVLL